MVVKMIKILRFTVQVILLWVISWLGNQIAQLSGLSIPGSVVGMILLFGLLCCGIIKLQHIQVAADFLLKHLTFFFIPIAVGLMNWGSLFYDNALILGLAIIISASLAFLTVGFLTQWLQGGNKT
jgi:holin-like protein